MMDAGENAARFEYYLNSLDITYHSVKDKNNDIIYLERELENGPNVSLGVMITPDNSGVRLYMFNYINIKTSSGVLSALEIINAQEDGPVCSIDEDRDVILQIDVPIFDIFSASSLYKLCEYMFDWAARLYPLIMKALLTQSN